MKMQVKNLLILLSDYAFSKYILSIIKKVTGLVTELLRQEDFHPPPDSSQLRKISKGYTKGG